MDKKKLKDIFSSLSDNNRLRLLNQLREKALECEDPETCDLSQKCCNVTELAEDLEITKASVSHHLKELKRSGLIETKKEGRYVYCSLNQEMFRRLTSFFSSHYLQNES